MSNLQESSPSPELTKLLAEVKRDTEHAARVLRETGTFSATGTFGVVQRVAGREQLISAGYPGPWAASEEASPAVIGYDGSVYYGGSPSAAGGARYAKVFKDRPEINTVIHVHTPYLGAWAGAHRSLPILYVPAQRGTFAREIPIYIDRRPSEASFIVEQLQANPHLPAILEANGGATFWGDGIIKTAQYILLLEEAARFQALAELLGGSRQYGPGVLEQQWRMTGLIPPAAAAA